MIFKHFKSKFIDCERTILLDDTILDLLVFCSLLCAHAPRAGWLEMCLKKRVEPFPFQLVEILEMGKNVSYCAGLMRTRQGGAGKSTLK